MREKSGFLFCICLGLLFGLPLPTLADTGYRKTVIWWHDVAAQVRPYQLTLQNLYAEVESRVGADKSKLNVAFVKRLNQEYPGSSYAGGLYGQIAINNYTKLGFDSHWNITSLSQRFNGLVKTYNLRNNSLQLVNGPNRVSLRLDLRYPERSQFTSVTIPALAVSAKNIWMRKRSRKSYASPLGDILNDVYAHRISGQAGTRMDELAEEMINNEQTRRYVLEAAAELYGRGMSRRLSQMGSPSRPTSATSSSQVSPSFNLFTILPWYFWPLLVGIGILKGATTTKRRRKTATWSWGKYLPPKEVNEEDCVSFESRQTLHSPAEQAFHAVLQQAIDNDTYQINGKTRLADVIQVDKQAWGPHWQAQFNRISSKHVDFVLLEKSTSRILGVIELDDSSHKRPDRQQRDRFVDRALERAGIPILHYPCRRNYSASELEEALDERFALKSMDWRL